MKQEHIRIIRITSVILMFISLFLPIFKINMSMEWGSRKPENAEDFYSITMLSLEFFGSQFKLLQFDFASNSFDVTRDRGINNFLSFFENVMLLMALVAMVAMILKEYKHDKINPNIINRAIYISNIFFIILIMILLVLKLIIRLIFDVSINRSKNIEYLLRSEELELYSSFWFTYFIGLFTLLLSSLLAIYSQIAKSNDYINFK